MLIFGHRGARGHAPENTMASFRTALEMGVDGIELDVQQTKDGKVVVCHDHALERISNGKGWLSEHTREELFQLDFGSWFAPQFAGEKIPTLREVLQWAAPTKLLVNIEIKNQARVHRWYERRFGRPYPKLKSAKDGIDRYLIAGTCIGLDVVSGEVYAPYGLDDVGRGVLRPNPQNLQPDLFVHKARSYQERWPWLRILESSSQGGG